MLDHALQLNLCANMKIILYQEYIGESGRTLGDRLKEHFRSPSPIHQHSNSTGHPVSLDFTTVHRKSQAVTRSIKEAMYIHVNDPSLNRNLGKYQAPHICNQVLQDTSALPPPYMGHPTPFSLTIVGSGTHIFLMFGWDSSVGRAADCHATGPRFNTCSTWLGVDSAFHPSVGR